MKNFEHSAIHFLILFFLFLIGQSVKAGNIFFTSVIHSLFYYQRGALLGYDPALKHNYQTQVGLTGRGNLIRSEPTVFKLPQYS
jgi:hypothetical protein